MIWLKLQGGLGNQMFQYAAVRTLVEEKRYQLVCTRSAGYENLLYEAFDLPGYPVWQNWENRHLTSFWKRKAPDCYVPEFLQYSDKCRMECFNAAFKNLPDGRQIGSWLQSTEYFQHNRERVLSWFGPRKKHRRQLELLESQLPEPAEKRCCIHVRRGDYKTIDEGLSGGPDGWILPEGYYRQAIGQVPDDVHFVVVSDDPEAAERMFSHLPDKTVLRGNAAVVDMFLMTRCRYNIIANSTFSWWGAWCNTIPGRKVIAPLYHTGWSIGRWCPDRLFVPDWDYLVVER